MLRLAGGVVLIAFGVAGVHRLMVWDTHFLLLAAFGAGCGGLAGWVAVGRRGVLPAAVVGFVAPLAYIPVWFAFDLPPRVDIGL